MAGTPGLWIEGAATDVRALPVSPVAFERLLGRRDVDGALLRADPALVRAAIVATRAEVRRVTAMLEGFAADPRAHERPQLAAMTAVLIYLNSVVEDLERAAGKLSVHA